VRVVERIENAVKQMTREELAGFRDWFMKYDAKVWDKQIETDLKAGKLDAIATKAIEEHKLEKTKDM